MERRARPPKEDVREYIDGLGHSLRYLDALSLEHADNIQSEIKEQVENFKRLGEFPKEHLIVNRNKIIEIPMIIVNSEDTTRSLVVDDAGDVFLCENGVLPTSGSTGHGFPMWDTRKSLEATQYIALAPRIFQELTSVTCAQFKVK